MKDPKAEALVSQFFKSKADTTCSETKTITVMKYFGNDNNYHFLVLDKFDITDELERLDYMNYLKETMLKSGEMKKHLWTKQTVLV